MSGVLVIAEHDGYVLNPSTAKCVMCASSIPETAIDVVVFACEGNSVSGQAASLDNVSRVISVESELHEHALAAVIAPQVAAMADDYSHILGPSTTFGRDLMPRLAALLGVHQISDVMSVEDAHTYNRPIYAGNVIVTVAAPKDHVVVATVRIASYESVAGGNSAPIESRLVEEELPDHTRFVCMDRGSSVRPDLQTAAKVVSGGRGVGSKENFAVIYGLADLLGASVGASRAAVDAGYAPNELQVGQTGRIIAPGLYVAIGISGAIQHLTGIKDAGTIVAINKDPDAPIFEVADIGVCGDLFEMVAEIEAGISPAKRLPIRDH